MTLVHAKHSSLLLISYIVVVFESKLFSPCNCSTFPAKLISFLASYLLTTMTTSRRLADRKVARFERNIMKRGSEKKGDAYPVGPIVLGFFIFIVVGSSLFQIIRSATSRGMMA